MSPLTQINAGFSHSLSWLLRRPITKNRNKGTNAMLIQIGIAAFVLIFFIFGAHATDNGQWKGYHLTPGQQNWFSTVTEPKSDLICCTIADGYPVTAEPRGNHFWINYKGHWYQVPDDAVIHDHVNPIGVPIAWLKLVGDYVTGIRCFLPADQT
jgi:hypothetical protein